MKKMLLNFADKMLSAEQRKAVKGGYNGTASNTPGIIPYTPPQPTIPRGNGGQTSNDCPGCY